MTTEHAWHGVQAPQVLTTGDHTQEGSSEGQENALIRWMGRKHEKTREDCGVGLLFCTHHEAYDSQERACRPFSGSPQRNFGTKSRHALPSLSYSLMAKDMIKIGMQFFTTPSFFQTFTYLKGWIFFFVFSHGWMVPIGILFSINCEGGGFLRELLPAQKGLFSLLYRNFAAFLLNLSTFNLFLWVWAVTSACCIWLWVQISLCSLCWTIEGKIQSDDNATSKSLATIPCANLTLNLYWEI